MTKEWQSLLDRYCELAETVASTDYSKAASLKAHNSAADQMRLIANRVTSYGSEAVSDFASLMDEESAKLWVAHHLLEQIGVTGELSRRALSHIEVAAEANVGEKLWLADWKAKHTN